MKIIADLAKEEPSERLRQLFEAIPYAGYLGVEAQEADGKVITKLPFQDRLVGNPNLPAVHGGVLGAFLELTSIAQLLHDSAYAQLPKTIDISFEYLRSAGPFDMYARAQVTRHGRRVANVRAELWQRDAEKLITVAHGHYLLQPLEQPR